jgi:hypothetical protein
VQPDERIELVCERAGIAVTDDHAKG